jgi:hypothetical protein
MMMMKKKKSRLKLPQLKTDLFLVVSPGACLFIIVRCSLYHL